MRDYLLDIVKNTYGLGNIQMIKITGTDKETSIETQAEDRSVIVQAKLNQPIPEFNGVFGMPNLSKLNIILGIPEYKEDAKITVEYQTRNNENIATGLHFENAAGDFKNDYRFMSKEIIAEKLKSVTLKSVKWSVDFEPLVSNIQRLKFMAGANSEELNFIAKTEGNDLKFYFGDVSSHAGNFVFHSGVTGTIATPRSWPVDVITNVLSLSGDKHFYISDEGVIQITVNTGLATYNYLIPAQSK